MCIVSSVGKTSLAERKKTVSAKKYLEGVEENVNKLDFRAAELNASYNKTVEDQSKLKEQQAELAEAIERDQDEKEANFLTSLYIIIHKLCNYVCNNS